MRTFTISGHVIRQNGAPVKGARITAALSQRRDRLLECLTGKGGEFTFTGLLIGKYSLQVNYHGYSQGYKQLDEYWTSIAVGPGLDSEHIVFPLESLASITGSVLDDAGDPVSNATVDLFGQTIYRGISQIASKGSAVTDADGSFHFSHLEPGTYYVAVSGGRPWYVPNRRPLQGILMTVNPAPDPPQPELDMVYPITYYGGSPTSPGAIPLQLEAGGAAEIQFNLHAVAAVHVTFEGVEKDPAEQINAALWQIGPGGALIAVQAENTQFGLSGFAPGDYLLSAALTGKKSIALGSQVITITGDGAISLDAAQTISVSGKVFFDDAVPSQLAVLLENIANHNQAFGQLAENGSFSVTGVTPGRYNLRLANSTELYLRTVKAKGGVYSNGQLDVSAGAHIELTVNAARGMTKVDGVATQAGKPYSGAMVLLLPLDFPHGNYIPRDQSDSDGTFTLNYAAPGLYTLVAIDNGRGLEYANPAVMAPYLASGRTIELPAPKGALTEIEVQSRR